MAKPNINELNSTWVARGQKVSDLATKLTMASQSDQFDEKKFKELNSKYEEALKLRNAARVAFKAAQEDNKVPGKNNKKPIDDAMDKKIKFVDKFVGMVKNDPKIVNSLNSSTDEKGNAIGLTIPVDQQTTIHNLMRDYQSLQNLVNVEAVSTASGSRVWEKFSDITPLGDLDDEEAQIKPNDDPKLTLIKFEIHRYAGISTITNTLLNDTADNLMAYLENWIARKVVVTRNQKIIETIGTQPKKANITKFDDVKNAINGVLDPAIINTSAILTNQSGFNVLTKVKDAKGRYLMQPDITNQDIYRINGKKVNVVADRWLPDNAGSHPFIFGDLEQGITLFDREQMSLLSTNIGGGSFETDTTKVRVIDRFDVELTDDGAFLNYSFQDLPDQVPAPAPSTPDTGKGK